MCCISICLYKAAMRFNQDTCFVAACLKSEFSVVFGRRLEGSLEMSDHDYSRL